MNLSLGQALDGFLLKSQFPWPSHIPPPLPRASGPPWISPGWTGAGQLLPARRVGAAGGPWPALPAQLGQWPRSGWSRHAVRSGIKARGGVRGINPGLLNAIEAFKMDFAVVLKRSLPEVRCHPASWPFPRSPMCFSIDPTSHHCVPAQTPVGASPSPFPPLLCYKRATGRCKPMEGLKAANTKKPSKTGL